jgi:HEAT repeat protein
VSGVTLPERLERAFGPTNEVMLVDPVGSAVEVATLLAEQRSSASEIVEEARASTLADLHEALRTADDDRLRAGVCWLLGSIGDRRSTVSCLARVLASDSSTRVRLEAAQALGRLDGTLALRALAAASRQDPEEEVRKSALNALGFLRFDDRAAADVALEKLADVEDSAEVRGYAAEALGHLFVWGDGPEDVVTALRQALGDDAAILRLDAAFALGNAGSLEIVADLERLARADHSIAPGWQRSVAQEAAWAIAHILWRAVKELLDELEEDDAS